MEYLPTTSNDLYLMHHGIKGMKWGVRRYQNYDGSLKGAGTARRGNPFAEGTLGASRKRKSKMSPETKKKIAIGAATVAGVLAVGDAKPWIPMLHPDYTIENVKVIDR